MHEGEGRQEVVGLPPDLPGCSDINENDPRRSEVKSRGSDLVSSFFLPSDGDHVSMEGMPRRLRLQYPGAIYHLMARGNGRQDIVCDDVDRDRLQEHLGRAAVRCSWRIYAFAIMSNHLHVVLKTPQPNLARGMQAFLSAYANGWSRRHRFFPGMSSRAAIVPNWWKMRPTSGR